MANIGDIAELRVLRETSVGLFLDSEGDLGEVLLPRGEMSGAVEIGGTLEVFLYRDSEDRPVVTLKRPKVLPGNFGVLEIIAVSPIGAFLDWGLAKDLLLPFGEQKERAEVGRRCVVHVHIDPQSGRPVASRRLSRYFSAEPPRFGKGQEVDLLLYGKTDLGFKAIVDGRFDGLLFANEVFRPLRLGERTRGYVAQQRHDGKLDLTLQAPNRGNIDELAGRIEEELRVRGGHWEIGDFSSPAEIRAALGVSKKAFKQATGALFRRRRITIAEDGLHWNRGGAEGPGGRS